MPELDPATIDAVNRAVEQAIPGPEFQVIGRIKDAYISPPTANEDPVASDDGSRWEALLDRLPLGPKSKAVIFSAALGLAACSGDGGDGNKPAGGREPSTSLDLIVDGTDGNGTEFAYAIPGNGSCAPYDREDGLRANEGAFDPGIDLSDAEAKFLKDNPEFAHNFALTSEPRIGVIFDALNVARPSANPEKAAESVQQVFENEFYVTAPLARDASVRNTRCDREGNVLDYRDTTFPAGTYVGGTMIEAILMTPDNKRAAIFKNGRSTMLPDNALVVSITLPDGNEALMLATHKAGLNTDADPEAEVGCENVLEARPPSEESPTTPPEEETTITTLGRSTTTIPGATTSSVVTSSTRVQATVPASTVISGPGSGGSAGGTVTSTSTTAAPATSSTQAPSTTSTVAPSSTTSTTVISG